MMKLVRRYAKIKITGKKGTLKIINNTKPNNIAHFEATIPFTTDGSKNGSTVTIYNLPKSLKNYIKNGYKCYVYAGFISETGEYNTIGKVLEGKISGLTPNTYNAGDKSFQFTVNNNSSNTNEAEIKKKTVAKVRTVSAQKTLDETITKYNSKLNSQRRKWIDNHPNATTKEVTAYNKAILAKKKSYAKAKRRKYVKQKAAGKLKSKTTKKTSYKPLTFAKGTHGLSIIKKIAKAANIKISGIKLVYNKKFTKGYTASSKPYTAIKAIAADCKTPVYWSNDKLYIQDYGKNKKTKLYIQDSTGLTEEPEPQTDSGSSVTEYECTFLLRPEINGSVIFHMKSPQINGWVIVKSGEHDISSDGLLTTVDIVSQSAYEAAEKKTKSAAKKADAKKAAKAKLDAKKKKALKAKQSKRKKK